MGEYDLEKNDDNNFLIIYYNIIVLGITSNEVFIYKKIGIAILSRSVLLVNMNKYLRA